MKILIIYYTQSGEAERVAAALAAALQGPDIEPTVERLRLKNDYPYPWRSIGQFFGVLPECHLGPLPDLMPPAFDPDEEFDLILLVYQVWFLAPSLPIQGLLRSDAARVFRDTRVITVSVSRNMWHSASETMKGMLRDVGARHIGNVALTHQGPAWATFITAPRALLSGKRDRFLGAFPRAGIGEEGMASITRLGEAIARQAGEWKRGANGPLPGGLGPVQINRRYLLPDLLGWYYFRAWAHLLRWMGRMGRRVRHAGIYCFFISLLLLIIIVLPFFILIQLILHPLVSRWTDAYARQLAEPSGTRADPIGMAPASAAQSPQRSPEEPGRIGG